MKRNTILKTLTAAVLCAAAWQAQAQGIYVNKKGGESIPYPNAVFDHVSPYMKKTSVSTQTYETGAVATLKYKKIADMKTARMGHQSFASGGALVVVGGHTTDFQLTKTAEIYENGQWRDISISNPHDGAFSVALADGRIMVGGGFSSAKGVGQSKATDIYNPQTKTFTAGPDMTVARAYGKGILVGGKVYVNGNWYADNSVMDCYDGTSFKSVGSDMLGLSLPYMFASKTGYIWTWSRLSCDHGKVFEFGKTSSGSAALLFDEFDTAKGSANTYAFSVLANYVPLNLSDDVRPASSYTSKADAYFFLTKNADGAYKLYHTNMAEDKISACAIEIPQTFPGTQTTIDYRSSIFVNEAKDEVYLIGSSGPTNNQTIYIISYNYFEGYWTIAKAEGFSHNLMTGSWTLLNDGTLACTGGGITSNFDAQKYAYIFTPPVAGASDSNSSESTEYGVEVYKKDGSSDLYLEDNLESITTFEEHFDERMTHEIPQEYLSKMSAYMPLYSGNTPPTIEGVWNMSPCVLVYDSKGAYNPGHKFTDVVVELSDQSSSQNTLTYRDEYVSTADGSIVGTSNKVEAQIVGSGSHFTFFVISTNTETDGSWMKQASLYSGTKTSSGIKDLYNGFVVLDKYDPNGHLMGIGEFRIINDQDGLSQSTTWKARQKAARTVKARTLSPDNTVMTPNAVHHPVYRKETVK